LRTHPETRERIERLMALKPDIADVEILPVAGVPFDSRSAFGRPVVRAPRWHLNGLWH